MPFIPLSTQGEFYLTCVRLSDAPEMARIMSIPQIYTRLQNPPYPYTLANAESWIKSQTNPIHKSTIELPFAGVFARIPLNWYRIFTGDSSQGEQSRVGPVHWLL